MGFSLNNISLCGLVLAIGIVVDDAIVVVENVERWIEHGLSPREAAYKSMEEVTVAVIAIAFGLSAVFIPTAFIAGITGQFYRQFALTIATSTLISAFNSLTLSPALAAILLQAARGQEGLAHRGCWTSRFGWFFRGFNGAVQRARPSVYERLVRLCIRGTAVALLVYVGPAGADLLRLHRPCRPASSPTRTRATCWSTPNCPTRPRWSGPSEVVAQMEEIAQTTPAVAAHAWALRASRSC